MLFLIDALAMFLFHRFPSLFFPWYRSFSKTWISFLSGLFSFVPVAVWDIGALLLILILLFSIIHMIVKKKSFFGWLSYVFLVVSVGIFIAIGGWMLNHYAAPLSEEIGLEVKEYSVEELYESTEYYLLKASEYSPLIEREEEGHALRQDFTELSSIAGSSYLKLAKAYPVFKGSSKPVKKLSLVGEYLLYNGIIGMFMPLTGEAGVPYNVPVIPLPFTMCHEAAHRLGIASEQEANFCAFLACINNEDVRFLYSGYYSAFSYCFSSLYAADREKAMELYETYKDDTSVQLIFLDRKDTRDAYTKYDSPLQEISDNINDTYLKTFSQESGIRSYGEVTDYLIAWYLQEIQ